MLLGFYLFVKKSQFILVALIALLITVPFSGVASAYSSGVISGMNQQRTSRGLRAYTANSKLSSSAYVKAKDMCTKNYWSHTSPSGATAWSLISAAGYSYRSAGENLAKGYTSASQVVSGWMNSSGHRANILSSVFTEVGVSTYPCKTPDGIAYTLTVAHFALPTSQPKSAPAPKPAPKPSASAPKKVQTPAPKATTRQTAPAPVTPTAKSPSSQQTAKSEKEKVAVNDTQKQKVVEKRIMPFDYARLALEDTLKMKNIILSSEFFSAPIAAGPDNQQ